MPSPQGKRSAGPFGVSRGLPDTPFGPVAAPEPGPERRPWLRTLPYRLYWAHLAALFGVALSNILLGLAVLASPASRGLGGLKRRAVRPVLWALGLYVGLLGISVLTSFDPAKSARSFSEVFSL